MDEYKPNSHKSRKEPQTPERRIEKVVSGAAKIKKKKGFGKFAGAFMSEDVGNVKSYILLDVVIPMVKDAALDILKTLFYGNNGGGSFRKSSGSSKVSYRKYFDDRDNDNRRERNVISRNTFDYDDITFDTYGDADSVLDAMHDIISQYGWVSVADFYDLADITTTNYTTAKYGWTDISLNLKPTRVRDGYILKLPRALPLN